MLFWDAARLALPDAPRCRLLSPGNGRKNELFIVSRRSTEIQFRFRCNRTAIIIQPAIIGAGSDHIPALWRLHYPA